ncbi:MAG TPA: hypothetical protein PKD10_07705 [Paracoccaceae bacterium]|nr:hypothetical protein [Paracoccaceae bacterium]HMO72183.1 hypothetical protein [Paracoccaceae bacterium]
MRLRAAALSVVLALPAAADPGLPAAFGRIEGAALGACTGVLVAPDQVLASATCLMGPFGGLPDPSRLTFRAGLTGGQAQAEAGGARLILHPSHQPGHVAPGGHYADAALLVLAAPLPGVVPAVQRQPAAGRSYSVAHYPRRDRSDSGTPVANTCRAAPFRAPYQPYECGDRVNWDATGGTVLDLGRGAPAVVGLVLNQNRSGGSRWLNTLPIAGALSDLRAEAAGRATPRVMRGGKSDSPRELPGRIGIIRP